MMPAKSFLAAFDALSASLTMSLGSTVLLYTLVAPQHVGAGVLALILALVGVHLFTSRSSRPLFYGARFFEAATIATMVLHTAERLPASGIPNTPATRLALLVSLLVMAALVVGVLWQVRAQRFARFVPAPVYVGFANTITVAIVLTQAPSIWHQAAAYAQPWLAWLMVATVLAVALAVRRYQPHWPAAAVGLASTMALTVLLHLQQVPLTTVMSPGQWTLPLLLADFGVFFAAPVAFLHTAGLMALNAVVIGTLMFLNTVVTGQLLSQTDDRDWNGQAQAWRQGAALLLTGTTGAAPISGAPTCSLAALRHGAIERSSLVLFAALALAVLLSQALVWVPLIAISAVMFVDAWAMWDRPSARTVLAWLAGRPTSQQAREDMLLIGCVMAASLFVNMMAGLLTGLLLGLLLHAVRSTRQPVRAICSGAQMASNCARSREEIQLLLAHSQDIRIFQLDSQQFFASAAQLNRTIREHSHGARYVVMDWSRVEHIDSSVGLTMGRLEGYFRDHDTLFWQAGARRNGSEVVNVLSQHMRQPLWATDLDRALEQVENRLIQRYQPALSSAFDNAVEPPWFACLSATQRILLRQHLSEHSFVPGQVILQAGAPSHEMWLIVRGRCSVYLHHGSTQEMRIAGVSPGTTVGEMGFLDGSPRSATVVAESTVQALCMTRAAFQILSDEAPTAVQLILAQLTIDLAARLRYAHARKAMG